MEYFKVKPYLDSTERFEMIQKMKGMIHKTEKKACIYKRSPQSHVCCKMIKVRTVIC